jgi:hypothetical protein
MCILVISHESNRQTNKLIASRTLIEVYIGFSVGKTTRTEMIGDKRTKLETVRLRGKGKKSFAGCRELLGNPSPQKKSEFQREIKKDQLIIN